MRDGKCDGRMYGFMGDQERHKGREGEISLDGVHGQQGKGG